MTDIVNEALYLMAEAAAEIERLRAFAKEVIRLSWEGAIDCGDVQEIAEKHGLIVGEVYDPAKHGENRDAVTDLVDRLRDKASELEGSQHAYGEAVLYQRAADEIEQLRGEVRRLQEALARATDPRTNQ